VALLASLDLRLAWSLDLEILDLAKVRIEIVNMVT
jgi:hypothetical protein